MSNLTEWHCSVETNLLSVFCQVHSKFWHCKFNGSPWSNCDNIFLIGIQFSLAQWSFADTHLNTWWTKLWCWMVSFHWCWLFWLVARNTIVVKSCRVYRFFWSEKIGSNEKVELIVTCEPCKDAELVVSESKTGL